MARYDRIAPLSSPEREQAFPCWPVLRDLEGQDRDADACRRARLRFLALRPVRRFADNPAVSETSFQRQLEQVREELRSLAVQDAERVRLTRFLRQIEEREPGRIVPALLEFAEQAHAAGHMHAAEEFARTAEAFNRDAAADVLRRMRSDEGAVDAASLEETWNALRQTEDMYRRARILEQMGRTLLEHDLLTAADRCFMLVTQRPVDPALRSSARAAQARIAAMQNNAELFRERRTALLADSVEWAADPRIAAGVHTDLSYGCLRVGDVDDAREHVRSAINIARRHNYARVLERAEQILTALEQKTEVLLPRRSGMEAAQRIAAQIEALELPTSVP